MRRSSSPHLCLQFEFELDAVKVGHKAKRQDWSIRHGRTIFKTDRDQDHLLVSRLPNWKQTKRKPFMDFENTVTIFSGAHGVGTASVHLLLDHLEVLKRLEAFAATCEFWQALITVTSTKTDAHPIIGSSRMIGLAISNNIICERVRVI